MSSLTLQRRNIFWAVVFTILTFGIYGLFWHAYQMRTMNMLLKEDKYHFWRIMLFSFLTFGFYFIYYEYLMASDIYELEQQYALDHPNQLLIFLAVVLSFLGFIIIVDALEQYEINRLIRHIDS